MFTIPLLVFGLIFSSAVAIKNSGDQAQSLKEDVQESVYMVNTYPDGRGSGFAVDAKSGTVVVTNAHICDTAPMGIELVDYKGKKHKTKILKADSEHDLCVLEAPKDAKPLDLAASAHKDEDVFIVGYPIIEFMTVQSGKLMGMEQFQLPYPLPAEKCKGKKFQIFRQLAPIRLPDGSMGMDVEEVCVVSVAGYVTTVPTDGGASGSPLLNDDGEVVGVVMLYNGNISWAATVPLPALKRFLDNN